MSTISRWVYRLALLAAIYVGVDVGRKAGIDSGVIAFLIGLIITSCAAFVFEIVLMVTDRVSRRIGL